MSGKLKEVRERYISLQILQKTVLGMEQKDSLSWLEEFKLHLNPRLAHGLDVEEGWESAIETVLSPYLNAICIESFDDITIDLLNKGSITLFDILDKKNNKSKSKSANHH